MYYQVETGAAAGGLSNIHSPKLTFAIHKRIQWYTHNYAHMWQAAGFLSLHIWNFWSPYNEFGLKNCVAAAAQFWQPDFVHTLSCFFFFIHLHIYNPIFISHNRVVLGGCIICYWLTRSFLFRLLYHSHWQAIFYTLCITSEIYTSICIKIFIRQYLFTATTVDCRQLT